MIVIESTKYKKSYDKLLKNKVKEQDRIEEIKNLFLMSNHLQTVLLNPYKNIYHIEQKKGNLKELYTARINQELRLVMKPIGTYPYNTMEITEIEFVDIDNKHYGEG